MLNFSAKILADSIRCRNRITTMELTYPRCIHSEFMTHRSHSRNAASSRAIPISRMLKNVQESPFIPLHWGAHQSGMQARQELPEHKQELCEMIWLNQRLDAVQAVKELSKCGLHKQIANRLLEPWMWITVITTANTKGWENFFKLRCHDDAEPHIQKIAYMARDLYDNTRAEYLNVGEWHLPLIHPVDDMHLSTEDRVKVSVGRCARVSYLTHDGKRDTDKDIELHDRLMTSGHWSPFEHVAKGVMVTHNPKEYGNLGIGYSQYRKTFKNEFV